MSPSPPLPLPPSSNDLIKTDLKHSLPLLTSLRCRCHSYMNAAFVNEWIGLTGVHVENALQSSRCAPVLTDWDVGEERAAYLALKPSLPLFYLLPSLSPLLSLSLCLSSHSTLPSCCLCLAPTLSHCTKWIPSASSFLLLVLMPVIVWFRQECETGRKRERQTRLEARHLWMYLYGTEGVSALRAGPTPILSDTSYWHVPEWDQQPTRVQEDDKERYEKAASFYQLCTVDVCLRKTSGLWKEIEYLIARM